MTLVSTLQNHLRVDATTFELFQQLTRYTKDLYNKALYIQRQLFFTTKSILTLSKLFKQIKVSPEYRRLPSDLGQQVLIMVNQNFRSFFQLLKKKQTGNYVPRVKLPYYLDKDDHYLLIFISRLFKLEKTNVLRLSLGLRGEKSTGTRYIYLDQPPLGIEPKQIRVIPRFKAQYFDIEYIYDIDPIPRPQPAVPDTYLGIDLGLDNFATCATTNETAFIIEGSGIKSYNRWWNKRMSRYQSRITKQGISGPTKRSARMQRKRRDVMNNFLNHVVRYILDYCLRYRIETIVVGEWGDMKRGLKMSKKVAERFQSIPYRWFKDKLRYKAELHEIEIVFQEESYTSQDCFNCGLRRKANRVHRGLYRCISCGMELNADINAALNIIQRVAPKQVSSNVQWSSGEITSPSRIHLVGFV